jgi:CRISPR-associated protein Cas1
MLGLQHSNRSNSFCLADDLMEPLRPLVDRVVRQLVDQGELELTPETKRPLLELLTHEVETGERYGPLMVSLHSLAVSLVRCFRNESKTLDIPVPSAAAAKPHETGPLEGHLDEGVAEPWS